MAQPQHPFGKAGEALHAAVDYLTVTASTEVGRAELEKIGKLCCELEAKAGEDSELWMWNGYVGSHCGGATFGERTDGAILRLSGAVSSIYYIRALQFASSVSRLDCAVTVKFDDMPKNLGVDAYRQVQRRIADTGEQQNAALTINTEGGQTFTLGRRISEKYARLYNKEVESKQPEYLGCWRYEVEYKGKAAKYCAKSLQQAADPAAYIQSVVYTHFNDRNVLPLFASGSGLHRVPVPRSRSDTEKCLAWLAYGVAPAVAKLMEKGRQDDVRRILGL